MYDQVTLNSQYTTTNAHKGEDGVEFGGGGGVGEKMYLCNLWLMYKLTYNFFSVDECSQYDCSGHGTCVMYQGTTPRCYCDDPNWEDSTGGNTDCDQAVCPDGSACQNGGTCL